MDFNISHPPPTEQVLHNARARLSRQLHRVRMLMVALYVTGAFSFPLGVFAAVLLTGNEIAQIPGQLVLISTLAVIAGVVYLLLRNLAEAEEMEHKLDGLRPVVDDCCGLSKLSAEFPLVDEYRAAVAAQERQMVFGEYLVIKEWFESKHGSHPGHVSPSP